MCVGVFANKPHCQSPSRRYPSSVGLGRPIRDAKVKAQPVFAAGSTAPTMPGTIGIHGRRLGRRGKRRSSHRPTGAAEMTAPGGQCRRLVPVRVRARVPQCVSEYLTVSLAPPPGAPAPVSAPTVSAPIAGCVVIITGRQRWRCIGRSWRHATAP